MRTLNVKKLLGIGLTVSLLALGLPSCSDTPVKPSDETKHKDHDEAFRVVVTLTSGHFHKDNFFHKDEATPGVKHFDPAVQKFVFRNDPQKGFAPVEGSPKAFAVRGGLKQGKKPFDLATKELTDATFEAKDLQVGGRPHLLTVQFFSADGKEITREFATEEESRIHQMFFIPEKIKPTPFHANPGKAFTPDYNYIGYYYLDTTPWDGAKKAFTGISNPIGLKGDIEFYEPDTSFTLHIRLMHATESKYDKAGKTSPFYRPTKRQLSVEDWEDLDIRIPIVVYASYDEYLDADTYEEMSAEDKLLVKKLSSALGITEKEAFDDLKAAKRD